VSTERLIVTEDNAQRFLEWIQTRGGIARWRSIDLSDPGYTVSTPAMTDGRPTTKPSGKVANEPESIVADATEIDVVTYVEVKRYKLHLRRGDQGLKIKLTDACSRRVRDAVAKAGPGATYMFDGDEVVILAAGTTCTLAAWAAGVTP